MVAKIVGRVPVSLLNERQSAEADARAARIKRNMERAEQERIEALRLAAKRKKIETKRATFRNGIRGLEKVRP